MAYSTSFDGAADTLLSSLPGWTAGSGYYDVLALNGSGALKHAAYSDDGRMVLNPTGVTSHYVKVVIGTGFISGNNGGIHIVCGATGPGGDPCLSLTYNSSSRPQVMYNVAGVLASLDSQTFAAGDEIELRWDYSAERLIVRKNSVEIYNEVIGGMSTTLGPTATNAGIYLSYSGRSATDDIFRPQERYCSRLPGVIRQT